MAFGISYADIELLIRLSQNRLAESEPLMPAPDDAILPDAIIPVLSETPSTSDSFSTKTSGTNIVATLTENIPPVSLTNNSGAEKASKNPFEENNSVADIVFNLTSQTNASNTKNSPVNPPPVTNNLSGAQPLEQSRTGAEIIFRSLLERFRTSVVYDYEASDAVQLEQEAARKHKPFENFSRPSAGSNETRAQTNRKKSIQDRDNLKREIFNRENRADDDKKRELLKKIKEANKFL
ncbi:MAG TPA: hypothetical protein VGB00_12055 [Pyrinomonadaceae bacterium]|jgi:hypothetical protein